MPPSVKHIISSSILAISIAGVAAAQVPEGLPLDAAERDCFARIQAPETVENVTERVIDTKASFEIREIPAVYATVEENHLIREGTTVYKSIPAVYKTVAADIEVEPGEIRTVMKQVLVEPARVIEETIAPKYETIEVQKLVTPARTERVEIPATYKTIERQIATGGTETWVAVLCETTSGQAKIAEVQAALRAAGHPLVVDGMFGPQTYAAMSAYQAEHGLPVGVLTISTVERLGVAPR